jgi:hypothetical protein
MTTKEIFVNSRNLILLALVSGVVHFCARGAIAQVVAESAPQETSAAVIAEATVEKRVKTLGFDELLQRNKSPLRLDTTALNRMPSRRLDLPTSPQGSAKGNWVKRHPILFGTLVGFGSGFVIGFAGGDDGVFYDFTALANGLFVGGIGAGGGASIGFIISR